MFAHCDQSHTEHLHKVTLQRDGRQASEAEVKDLGVMLSQRGVMQIPACVLQTAQKQHQGEQQPGESASLNKIARAHTMGSRNKPTMGFGRNGKRKRNPRGQPDAEKSPKACRRRPVGGDAFTIYVKHATEHCCRRHRCGVRPWSPGGEAR